MENEHRRDPVAGEAASVATARAHLLPEGEEPAAHSPTAFERLAPAILLTLLGGFFLVIAVQLPVGTFESPGSGMWPTIASVALLLLGIVAAFDGAPVEDDPEAVHDSLPRLAISFAMLAGFVVLFWTAGYLIATVMLVIAMAKGLAGRSWLGAITVGVIAGLAIDLFFAGLLDLLSPSEFNLFS